MPHLTTDDGIKLFYEETGTGTPIVFVHEFAGDYRSYETADSLFCRHYRCIAYNARGFRPPTFRGRRALFAGPGARRHPGRARCAEIDNAHIVGLSMGGFAALHFGFTYSHARVRWSLRDAVTAPRRTSASNSSRRPKPRRSDSRPRHDESGEAYALGPTRVQYQNKDPRGWREFNDQFAEHSTEGSALTIRGMQKRRPSLYDLIDKMKTITAPTLIMTGDEDWPCLEPGS